MVSSASVRMHHRGYDQDETLIKGWHKDIHPEPGYPACQCHASFSEKRQSAHIVMRRSCLLIDK